VRELQGLALRGAPPRIFEILGKKFGTQTVDQLAVTVMHVGAPNYFSPIGDGPVGAIEWDRTLAPGNFAPREFSKLSDFRQFSDIQKITDRKW
jgi:hypothetical protein